jgi:NADPH:quinone reductase-like Zn-dependent oxidoreductase
VRAAVVDRYGSVAVREVDRPAPAEGEVLVEVRASSLNAIDWYGFSGRPFAARVMMGLRGPKTGELGSDFAGVVAQVGSGAGDFEPGDEVFGVGSGALAEYMVASDALERKPANVSFDEAATLPVAGLTALQGLRDHGAVRPGQTVLVNGGSGGVGTLAVQVARALGAQVHAVCSTHNVEQARALGATRVFDYAQTDFTRSGERYDVLFDNAGNRSWAAMRRVLAPDGMVVLVGGPRRKRLLGPLGHVARITLLSKAGRRRAVFFVAKPNRADLAALRDLVESGEVRPLVEQRLDLAQVAEAMRAMGEGHVRSKLVVRP